jgi:hypothetical protein
MVATGTTVSSQPAAGLGYHGEYLLAPPPAVHPRHANPRSFDR